MKLLNAVIFIFAPFLSGIRPDFIDRHPNHFRDNFPDVLRLQLVLYDPVHGLAIY